MTSALIRNTLLRQKTFRDSVACDLAVSEATVLRHLGSVVLEPSMRRQTLTLMPEHARKFYVDVTYFYPARSRGLEWLRLTPLMHLLGTAAMRHLLQAQAKDWRTTAHAAGGRYKPDALWTTPAGVVAIEFDTGRYRREVRLSKMAAFEQAYPRIIWGTSSPARAQWMRRAYPKLEVLDVDFWTVPSVGVVRSLGVSS